MVRINFGYSALLTHFFPSCISHRWLVDISPRASPNETGMILYIGQMKLFFPP